MVGGTGSREPNQYFLQSRNAFRTRKRFQKSSSFVELDPDGVNNDVQVSEKHVSERFSRKRYNITVV